MKYLQIPCKYTFELRTIRSTVWLAYIVDDAIRVRELVDGGVCNLGGEFEIGFVG